MKKRDGFKVLLVMALVCALCLEAFVMPFKQAKAEGDSEYVTVSSKSLKKAKINIKVTVNGVKLKKKAFKVTATIDGEKEDYPYIPSKSFIENVGGSYTLKGKKVTVNAGNIVLKFKQGKNAYDVTVTYADGEKEKFTLQYGKSIKRNGEIYIPLAIVQAMASFADNVFDATLKKKSLSVDVYPATIPVSGGWGTPETPVVPEKVSETFAEYNEINKDDEQIIPVAVLSQQVVAGMNYELLCRISNPSKNEDEVYAIVKVYADLEGNIQVTDEMKTSIKTNINGLPGGWDQCEDITFPEEYRALVEQQFGELQGVSYNPLAIIAKQVVAGYNLCILCEAKVVYPGAQPYPVLVYVYISPSMSAEITSIETLDNRTAEEVDNGEEDAFSTNYKQLSGSAYAVFNQDGLAEIVNDDENTWNNIAFINDEMVIDREIDTMGSIGIQSGATVTVEKGGQLAGHITVEEGATVIVKDGGFLTTAMGDDEGIYNMGTIIVEKGGMIMSRMGSTIVNAKGGKITVDGTFVIGSIKNEGQTGIWFKNEGIVDGKGTANLNKIVAPGIADEDIDMDECKAMLLKLIGEKTGLKIGVVENFER